MWKFLGHIWSVCGRVGAVLVVCVVICVINHVLVSRRPEMTMNFGFTKWNRGWISGLPMDNPLLGFRTVKISPGLCELDKNRQCVVCLNC